MRDAKTRLQEWAQARARGEKEKDRRQRAVYLREELDAVAAHRIVVPHLAAGEKGEGG